MEKKPFIQVYCPELQSMIRPGEWAMCPYFSGGKVDGSSTEDVLKQIFRCHVQCGCEIQYQYYKDKALVTTNTKVIDDPEVLREIIAKVVESQNKQTTVKSTTVLLADDDPDFLDMHSAVLRHKGYEVIAVDSGAAALKQLTDKKPDLVILDVMMERFDTGFTTCKEIKEIYPDLPVILLTSIGAQTGLEFSSNEDVLKITGANLLLDKPISPKLFLQQIEDLIQINR